MKRVLIVDDDKAFARSIFRVLSSRCDVECVHSVPAALSALRDGRRLAAVWSDRQLPEPTGGITVLCAAAKHHPEALLVMVTGDPEAEGIRTLPRSARVFAKTSSQQALDWLLAQLSLP
jgi:DNA-binding NtrC family response regulator